MMALLPGQDRLNMIVVQRQILLIQEWEITWGFHNILTLDDIYTWMLGR